MKSVGKCWNLYGQVWQTVKTSMKCVWNEQEIVGKGMKQVWKSMNMCETKYEKYENIKRTKK